MCVTTRKERENDRPEAILSSKITPANYKASFLNNPPKTEDEKYVYDIIQKAYWINEKKIEMLDFEKNKNLIKAYYNKFKGDL